MSPRGGTQTTIQSPTITTPASPLEKGAGTPEPKPQVKAPVPPEIGAINEFQEFVGQSVGRILPIFGYDLFTGVPDTFAPVDRIPVTPDYLIGPGDELLIRAWGQIDVDYRAMVDRNGEINIPKVGTVHVAGIKYQDLRGYLKTAISRVFRNFDLNVTLGQLRSIQVYVVGQARRPGNYTVSSLSTLVNTLFASGGPSVKGSMRHIQLKRNSELITEFDLYDLLLKGDKSKDKPLLPGDVIFIPPIGDLVAITGSVNNPAIYELKDKASLEDLIQLAGGLTNTATGQKVLVERIIDRKVRKVDEFSLDKEGLARLLQDGDLVRVLPLSPRFENAVTLRGSVATPARYPWREGLRIRDIIPEKEALIVPDYWIKQNLATRVQIIGQERLRTEVKRTFAGINWDYAVIERLKLDDLTTTLIPFNLGKAILENDDNNNLLLEPGDVVTIFSKDDISVPIAKQTKYVRLEGEFNNAGVYQAEPGETLRQMVSRITGFTPNAYLFGAEFTRETTRLQQQKRLEEFIDRLEKDIERSAAARAGRALSAEDAANLKAEVESRRILVTKLRQLKSTGRIVLEISPEKAKLKDLPDLPLEDGDRFYVPARPSTVAVLGAVYNENAFLFKPSNRVSDYLTLAGGPTREADNGSIYVIRANGSVISKRQSSIFSGFEGERLMPGDTVIVPEEIAKFSLIKELKDWSQIIYQLGLGAAAIKVLSP